MRLDGPRVTNGAARGICYREINLLGAILRDAHRRVRSQGNIAQAFSRTAPVPAGAQSVAAVVLGRGIVQLLLRKNGLAGKDHRAEFTGGYGRRGRTRLARLISHIAGVAAPDHAAEGHGCGRLRGVPGLAEDDALRSAGRAGNLLHPLLRRLTNLIVVDNAFQSLDVRDVAIHFHREFDRLAFEPLVCLRDIFGLRIGAVVSDAGGGTLVSRTDAHGALSRTPFRSRSDRHAEHFQPYRGVPCDRQPRWALRVRNRTRAFGIGDRLKLYLIAQDFAGNEFGPKVYARRRS